MFFYAKLLKNRFQIWTSLLYLLTRGDRFFLSQSFFIVLHFSHVAEISANRPLLPLFGEYVFTFRKGELGTVLRRYHSELLDCLLELGHGPDLYPFSQLLEDYQVNGLYTSKSS